MTDRIRVAIADDDPAVRKSLGVVVGLQPDMELVGEAADGAAATALVAERTPDVLVIDILMPRGDGIETVERLRREHPEVAVIFISGSVEYGHRQQAMALADRFLAKPVVPDQAIRAIHEAVNGARSRQRVIERLGAIRR